MRTMEKLFEILTSIPRKIKANYIISRHEREPDFISRKGCCPYTNPRKYPIPSNVCNAYMDIL